MSLALLAGCATNGTTRGAGDPAYAEEPDLRTQTQMAPAEHDTPENQVQQQAE